MKFVTSIAPHRIPRQQFCIESWRKYNLPIVAVQLEHEIANLVPHFPDVTFISTTAKDNYFGSNCPRIYPLIKQCNPGIIINADIELTYSPEVFIKAYIAPPPKEVIIGIRWEITDTTIKLNKYGLDVFRLQDTHHRFLPDNEFAVGQPGWDYWIPLILRKARVPIVFRKDVEVRHEVHDDRYAPEKIGMAHKVLTKYLKTPAKTTTNTILSMTERL